MIHTALKRFGCAVATAAVLATGTVTGASADVLDKVMERGTLVVGVKADYKPYGFLNPDGDIVGIEPDLAQDVADTLGVELELVPVVASNRMQFLDQGKIDLMIATMTDRPDRRKVVNILNPDYYSSGTNIIARKSAEFDEWEDLEGVPVCGIQGAFYNRKTQREFGAKIVGFTGTSEALNALQQGRCAAFVYDDSFLASRLQEAEWSEYNMPLQTIDDAPWGLAVKHGEERFARFMSGMVVKWHVDGRIVELEKEYGIKPTPFTQRMHELFSGFVPKEEG
ncbi:transporter substrate-binding domain-containing protein [Ferruginivarius sediminum]|uniref:ABC transporter substrate-binding protein n=1 Tax=Ferruginivarius sediminum TaxID=2661937 RepID=A0A369T7X5_9PROT|nr:transporter substrate-binding domain-containing protein [Ferruginivarius sediminum]RDD61410.1 ABC transporter substrate-binding protein [Ferruginivarius sediminum]